MPVNRIYSIEPRVDRYLYLNLTDLFGDFVLSVSATLGSIDFKVLFPKRKYIFPGEKQRPTESKAMAVASTL